MAAAGAPDGDTDAMMFDPPSIDRSSTSIDGQKQSVESAACSGQDSTAFPVSLVESQRSVKTLRSPRTRPPTPAAERPRAASSASTRSRPRSILVSTDVEPVVQVSPAASTSESHETSAESESPSPSSPSSSENELQSSATDDSSRTTLTSSCSSSCIGSAASSMRTRVTSTCSPCVTFAPLPEIGPRQRKSSRPLGLAARGQILRQRRMMMAKDPLGYYEESVNSIPGGERMERKAKDGNERARRDDVDEADVAIAALGKMIGDFWQRVAHSKSKTNDTSGSASKPTHKRPKPARSFTWSGRFCSKPQNSGLESDDDSESDVDGPWSRRRDEDPMTKTIMEGSDDGLDEFVLEYDTISTCDQEEEEQATARANEHLRTTVEVHLVKATEGESKD